MPETSNKMYSLEYRPYSLNDMVGQKGILVEFKNRSYKGNFPQVMIFEGLSGTGKTTLALIVAGILNCKEPKRITDGNICYINPCGICKPCIDIKNEVFGRDIYFLDASSMSKDDVLNIQNKVNVMPMYDKNKIIIVDEAQELSKASKGATLKLLEKPRKNVYYILCTMDSSALVKAIKSRGQTYRFKSVSSDEIAKYLWKILKKENLSESIPETFIKEGIFEISKYAEGNVREAIQYLERCLYGEYYSKSDILKNLGLISKEDAIELIFKLLKRDVSFFSDIEKLELKSFFYLSWKILVGANIYKISNVVDEIWKKKTYNQFKKLDDLFKLLNVYVDIYNNTHYYFNNNYYLSKIIEFYDNKKLIRKNNIQKDEVPIRPKKY